MGIEQSSTLGNIAHNAGHWLTVSQLAKKFKVHPETIRRWANSGRLKHIRHPINKYRLFLDTDFSEGKDHD
ncbi:helix-turn-helix domain-containing protein [Bdellovibrio bacteriovorus]|uniref:Helix-turn-helix domain-containing protein n=1 Tax=Bdellovibrio bacteriovorus TaxID=959 RepID=A0A1Z3NA00_BDEBC|nr:helix-turn-helix domain-containing protein [Bdellovibrio bacteriovorus]ASD64251.1 hypothetical protein B9G79_12070 [Bdellovibrio bacteriovorus]